MIGRLSCRAPFLVVATVATTSAEEPRNATGLPPGVKGVAAGRRANLPHAGLTRTEAGKWTCGWTGDEAYELEVLGDRIRSAVVVSVTRTPRERALGRAWNEDGSLAG